MLFKGFPDVKDMHTLSVTADNILSESSLNFYLYILESIKKFSGLNSLSRIVCDIRTREYMIFFARKGHDKDIEDIPEIADRFQRAGYYVETDLDKVSVLSGTCFLLICWDPEVIKYNQLKSKITDEGDLEFYMTVCQYVKAEKNLLESYEDIKDELLINGCFTKKWVSISVINDDMYRHAMNIGKFLWGEEFYVGIIENKRRAHTWTLFVCWDDQIIQSKGDISETLEFHGSIPKSWNTR